jgi:DNA-binding SARP family transcriptional activator
LNRLAGNSPVNSCVNISLLGPPIIQYQDGMLDIPRRQVRALLYFLAVQREPVNRTKLCLLLWPDQSESESRRNLTRTLTHLKRALPYPEALVAAGDLIYLDERFIYCDVHEFNKLCNTRDSKTQPEKVLDLYRDSFLSGFFLPDSPEFENWVSQQQTAFEIQFLNNLSWLVDENSAKQNYAEAVLCARRYLDIDELSEEIHRKLIALYALSGDRARSIHQYEECISVLESELGAKPLPETQAVYQAVITGKSPGLIQDRVEVVFPSSIQTLRLDIPLVGRGPIIQHLDEIRVKVQTGQRKFVLISGEAGIGKSRLLYDFANRSKIKGQVLFGSGQLGEGTVPYQPVVEALRSAPITSQLSLPSYWLAEIIRLLPELSNIYPDIPTPYKLKGEEARIRLFDALSHYLLALQLIVGALWLCFDDLHWFDRTSLNWLAYFCRMIIDKNSQIMIVATCRSEDLEQVHGLREQLSRLGLLDEIKLDGLDTTGIQELFYHMFSTSFVSDSLVSRIKTVTGGNPFFILETLKALDEEGKLSTHLDQLGDFPLPESVKEAINWRFDLLNPRSRQVLEAGAVLGSRFRFDVLRVTAGRSELETSLSLDILETRRLIISDLDQYRFSHDLIRRVAVSSISAVRLRILHIRAGRALEKLEPNATALIAQHFDAGGEWEKAVHYYERSVATAEALFAWQEMESHLFRMLELLKKIEGTGQHKSLLNTQYQSLARLIQIHYIQGLLEQRDRDLIQLQELTKSCQDPLIELQAKLTQVQQLNNDTRYQDAITLAEQNLNLPSFGKASGLRCRLLAQMGLAYHFLGYPDRALSVLQDAQSYEQFKTDLDLQASIMIALGQVYRALGDYPRALHCVQRAYACHQQLGDPYLAARYGEIGMLYSNLCMFEEARQFLEESLSLAKKAGVRTHEGHILLAWGSMYLYRGDVLQAICIYQQTLDILVNLRNNNLTASALASLGFAYYHLGDLVQGRKYLDRSLTMSRQIGHRMRISQVLLQMGLFEIAEGNLLDARELLREGLTIAREVNCRELVAACLNASSRLGRFNGYIEQAKNIAIEALSISQELNIPAIEIWSRIEAGLSLVRLNMMNEALEHTQIAVDLIPHAHQYWISHVQALLAHVFVLKLCGNRESAEKFSNRAQEIISRTASQIPDLSQRRLYLDVCMKFAECH